MTEAERAQARQEIRQELDWLEAYVAEHGDPREELAEMYGHPWGDDLGDHAA
ncbi:MAG: hypothetical protein WDN49_16030 [Acetobacteraceae bacterium]